MPDVDTVNVIDAENAPLTDAVMLAGAQQAGEAYRGRLIEAERLDDVDDRVTGMLIFDDAEAIALIGALAEQPTNAVIGPLYDQLVEWLDGVRRDERETSAA